MVSAQELASTLRTRLAAVESATSTAVRQERANLEREFEARLQAEREKWEESTIPTTLTPATVTSPVAQTPYRPSAPSITESYFLGYTRKPPSRAPSVEPPRSPSGFRTPPVRQDSLPYQLGRSDSFPHNVSRSSLPAGEMDREDADYNYFDSATPTSPHRNQDMVSVSTVAAGPSVQLVERMSAAVRRLESEMAGSREELARVVSQRDEARKEIVALMTEVEAKREAEERVKKMEAELADGRLRLETTLEMLGDRRGRGQLLRICVQELRVAGGQY